MVRFKVVKGSHLLLGASICLLVAVIVLILVQWAPIEDAQQTSNGAKVEETFASAVSNAIQIKIIPDATPEPAEPGKSILIYHTHTHEAYEQTAEDPYEAIETWRTTDPEHSILRVGDALAEALRNMGYEVVHDMSDHEQDDLNSSYVRSLETLESYSQRFDLYIDLHRDAYISGMPLSIGEEKEYAQAMLLVGRGDNHSPAARPNYDANLYFAQLLTSEMNGIVDGICRNVTVKTGRYNQHIGTPAILIEVGHNKNTLSQALNTVPVIAAAINKTMQKTN